MIKMFNSLIMLVFVCMSIYYSYKGDFQLATHFLVWACFSREGCQE